MDAPPAKAQEPEAVGTMGVIVPPRRGLPRLSPINKRRWQNFKSHRRGWWSLWIFLILFTLSLFADRKSVV